MRLLFVALGLYLLFISPDVYAQDLSGEKRIIIEGLLDSAEIYKLKNPDRTLQMALTILSQLPEQGNETLSIRAHLHASNSLKMMSRKAEALDHATRAMKLSDSSGKPEYRIRSAFMKATIFGQDDNYDSAMVYYQKVIALHQPGIDPYYVSSAYTNVGTVYSGIGNYAKAEEYYLKGYELSAGDNFANLFALASLIGFYVTRDNPKYLPYLDTLAMSDFYKNASRSSFMAHFDSFLLLDEATAAEKEKTLREVYAYALEHGSWANQTGYGMKLYEHLMKMHRYEEGYQLLLELLQKAYAAQNGHDIAAIHRALYENCKDRGDLKMSLHYLERHSELRDSLLSDENTNRISELNIKFETAQKDNEIERQKIKLEQEKRNRNFLTLLAALLLALAATVYFYFRNRARSAQRIADQEKVIHLQETERFQKEKEVAELTATLETQEKERNRIARDLHDGLGSMMSGISSQVEYLKVQPSVGQAALPFLVQLKEMINEATSELRRTSYELMPAKLLRQGLEPAIRDLCLNALVKNGIEPTLEINADLAPLDPEKQLTLYRIVQELLNNIVKHASASKVLIQFNSFDNEISLVVEDNGKGFDVADKRQNGGLGLGSLQSRVNFLKGFLDIASIPGEGTTVTVNFNL